MKALIVTRVSGFLPQFEMNNVKILQEMGYEVHYAANFHTIVYGKDNSRLDGTGVIRHQIDFERSPFSPSVRVSYRQLKKLLQEEQFDLIHCHMPMSAVVTRLAAQAVRKKTGRKVPVMYTAHGLHFYTGAPLTNWFYYPVERFLARYTDRLILINEEDYARAKKFPVRGKVEHTMGIGMRLEKYQDCQKKEYGIGIKTKREQQSQAEFVNLHEKYQIPSEHAVLISVGELTKRKNNITMIDAMKELGDLPVSYLICGSGPKEEELKRHVKELGLEKRIKFAGYVTEVPKLLQQADCFVFPSFQEGLPVAVMEAMAVGLPVIATGIRGITDLIEHTRGGYLVEDWEPENYAVKVRRMFEEREGKSNIGRQVRREQMGQWNRERIREFALPVVEEEMRQIYQSVQAEWRKGCAEERK
ncbi:MAG: glycosyltransferase family 4 protein [Lachnospiraceae bacterium]|nr:glycosyltransferase family 4 protein [Lachnospiraceae bacterium]